MNGLISMRVEVDGEKRVFLLAHEDEGGEVTIVGLEDSSRAREYVEGMYAHALSVDRQFTAGACIHLMECEYRVHNVGDIQELVGSVVVLPFQPMRIAMTNASRTGIPLLGPEAEAWVESGEVVGFPEHGGYVW